MRLRPTVPRRGRRLALAGSVVALAIVVLTGSPAAADPPGPTDYRSEVTDITPEVDGITASVVGGDGFLLLEVEPGTTVEVPGYTGEPYLRFGEDGTVEENQASAATYLNESRTRTEADRDYDPEAEPEWEEVATDGRWAWHDHRIHSMAGDLSGDTEVAHRRGVPWTVPLVVDGDEVTISGSYRLLDAPSPLPWAALAIVLALALALGLGRVVPALPAAGATVLVAGIGGIVAGMAQRGESPPGAPTSPLVVILPAIAAVAGIIVLIQRGRVLRAVAALAGAAAAGGWAIVRLPVLWKAVLPTSLPAGTDRALTAVALGAAAGAAALVVRSGALAPDLGDPDGSSPAPEVAESA
ncbi:hypothetical protein HC251_00070 [Iamia sp. SCSIO 61187]|uniref:hypothetical protein n=1 Tax=Iamia sp. SCSIO 61187 TaxID=2722752 RepID=UPI001C62FBE2|nr:hypothetical protein [Iamia sp. SCSIO 61187]QYG90984.1 hypothetical protein HC251_00070 [Iamia sp. SCSIO 61187]